MTLNGVMAIILPYFTEFGSFRGQLHTRCSAITGLLRRSRSFKVIEIGTNRKSVCDFLLVISNLHAISYCFGVIAAYCSNFGHFAFLSLETKYDVHYVQNSA